MKILLTGADGLLGSNLCRELLKRNHTITALLFSETAPSLGIEGLPIHRIYGNIVDKTCVKDAVAGHDIVIHAAASTQVYPARSPIIHEVNVKGTANIIYACLFHRVKRLIHVGTANSFSPGSISDPGNEDGPFTGHHYGLDYIDTKYEAQQLVLEAVNKYQLNAVIVNPVFMIGPYDSKPSSGALILALYNKKIPAYSSGSKSYIAVKDAAIAIANAITLGQTGQCYILSNFHLSHKDALQLMADTIGVRPPSIPMPDFIVKWYGKFSSMFGKLTGKTPTLSSELALISCEAHCYSGEKARNQLNMPCTDLRIAVSECFQWFKEQEYLHKKI